jgi:DNA-binding NarL/FixJ family response regulator
MQERQTLDIASMVRLQRNLERLEANARSVADTVDRLGTSRARTPFRPRSPLTPRETMILRMIADGRDNAEIAAELHFALGTIKLHVREILEKLGASSRTEAAVIAVRQKYI